MLNFRPNKHSVLCVACVTRATVSSRGLDCTGNPTPRLRLSGPQTHWQCLSYYGNHKIGRPFLLFPISACSPSLLLNRPHLQEVLTRYSDKEKDPQNGHWPVSKNVANFTCKNWGAGPLWAGYVIMQTQRDKSLWRLGCQIQRGGDSSSKWQLKCRCKEKSQRWVTESYWSMNKGEISNTKKQTKG